MPSEKRARQRAGREQRKAEAEKKAKRSSMIRRGVLIAVIAVVVIGSIFLFTHNSSKSTASTTTTAPAASTTSTSAPSTASAAAQAQANNSSKSTASTTTTAPAASTTSTSAPSTASAAAQAQANKVSVAAGCPASPSTRVNTLTWSSAPAMTISTSKIFTAVITTDLGPITVRLDPAAAPQTVNNFVFLAKQNYYHCVIFHRVIPSFMDQTGDPTGTGTGGPGYTIPDELPKAANPQYPIGSLAMANTGQANSGGSQFFIVAGPEGESLPPSYTLFGHVIAGMDIAEKINAQGSTSGTPPTVTHRMLSVKITES